MTWPAGRVLSEYVVRRGMMGKSVLELGSGTGLVGIAAAKASAGRVFITDQRVLLPIMTSNVELNDLSPLVQAEELNWGEPLPTYARELDVILAADCVYYEPAYPLLIQTLRDLCTTNPGVEILFCYRQRRKADKKVFLPMLKKAFTVREVTDDQNKAAYSQKGVCLLTLTPKSRE